MDNLAAIARQNLSETYMGLGECSEGGIAHRNEGFWYCESPVDLAFCNFALHLDLDRYESGCAGAMTRLRELSRFHSSFRVFAATGDSPSDVREVLSISGFRRQHGLVALGANPSGVAPNGGLALLEATDLDSRIDITKFMANQFFSRNSGRLRHHVVESTSRSSHHLFGVELNGQLVAGVMLTGMESAVGLYNLCVLPNLRRKGLGSQIVLKVSEIAFGMGIPVVLQCEPSLEGWYQRLGFRRIGTVEAFSFTPSLF